MKIYSHDYKLPAEVDNLLHGAQQLIARDQIAAALDRIGEARLALQQYMAGDNMVLDDDCADGWIRQQDYENERRQCDILPL